MRRGSADGGQLRVLPRGAGPGWAVIGLWGAVEVDAEAGVRRGSADGGQLRVLPGGGDRAALPVHAGLPGVHLPAHDGRPCCAAAGAPVVSWLESYIAADEPQSCRMSWHASLFARHHCGNQEPCTEQRMLPRPAVELKPQSSWQSFKGF